MMPDDKVFDSMETIRAALSRNCNRPNCTCQKPNGNVHCPAHQDYTPSFSIAEKDGRILGHCHAGCSPQSWISALKAIGIDIFRNVNGADLPKAKGRFVETYDYPDATGKLILQVCRTNPKGFFQRRPNGKGGWINRVKGLNLVPYRLPELTKAERVYIGEGEKDYDALAALGLTATTNVGGAGKWRREYNQYFQGKAVVVLPDNDPPGKAHALDVARNLCGVAANVKIVEIPGLPEKGDVSDWLKAGGNVEQLQALVEAAPEYDPAQAQEKEIPTLQDERKPTQAEMLIKLAGDAELFHDVNLKGFATIEVDGHRETWPIRSKGFKSWLSRRFYEKTGKVPGGQAWQDAMGVLEAQAHFDGPEHKVHVRVAHLEGKIFIDLANDSWQAVEITSTGYRVMADPPVKFRRPRGLTAMPTPRSGGSLDDLKPFVNCNAEDWPLVVAWLISAFSAGPYPPLDLQSEQGGGKSTAARALKSLADPGSTLLRAAPRNIQDLMIAAANSWCLSFDNLSDLKAWLSDGFCRLSTGGGMAARELYSDDEEVILDAVRPIILNGIDSLVSRGDLADRIILIELPRIKAGRRRREGDLWKAFEVARPGILGAVFDALSAALANLHKVELARLPRMADFAAWIVAAESALPWKPGAFMAAYTRNRAEVREHSLEADHVAMAVQALMERNESWEGTPSELLTLLEGWIPAGARLSKSWPKAANSLSNRLRRAAPALRAGGIEIERAKSGSKNRTITIFKKENEKDRPDRLDRQYLSKSNLLQGDDPGDDPENGLYQLKATAGKGWDDRDDKDDKNPTLSKANGKEIPVDEVEL